MLLSSGPLGDLSCILWCIYPNLDILPFVPTQLSNGHITTDATQEQETDRWGAGGTHCCRPCCRHDLAYMHGYAQNDLMEIGI